jgi:hypothetical protein
MPYLLSASAPDGLMSRNGKRPKFRSSNLSAQSARSAGARKEGCNLLIARALKMVERESEYLALLKTCNLLIFRDGQNAENSKIAPNWNVSGTRDFSFPKQNANHRIEL